VSRDEKEGCAVLIFWVGVIISASALLGWYGFGMSLVVAGLVARWEARKDP